MRRCFLNRFAGVFVAFAAASFSVQAQGADPTEVDRLLGELSKPEQPGWEQIEQQLRTEWSKSGSAAMDLLLQRGLEALEAEDFRAALEHLTALTDHAPGFAEGWNARATVHFRMDNYGMAVSDIAQALTLEPRHFAAMTGFGIILAETGQELEALEVFRRVKELNPHNTDVQNNLERLELAVGGSTL